MACGSSGGHWITPLLIFQKLYLRHQRRLSLIDVLINLSLPGLEAEHLRSRDSGALGPGRGSEPPWRPSSTGFVDAGGDSSSNSSSDDNGESNGRRPACFSRIRTLLPHTEYTHSLYHPTSPPHSAATEEALRSTDVLQASQGGVRVTTDEHVRDINQNLCRSSRPPLEAGRRERRATYH